MGLYGSALARLGDGDINQPMEDRTPSALIERFGKERPSFVVVDECSKRGGHQTAPRNRPRAGRLPRVEKAVEALAKVGSRRKAGPGTLGIGAGKSRSVSDPFRLDCPHEKTEGAIGEDGAGDVDVGSDELENYKLLAAAREFLERLLATIRYSELFDPSYAVSSRLKKAARLQDKIVAKRQEGRLDYSLSDVTDIIGIRFISLYRQDVTQNVRAVLELVAGETDVSPNALQGLRLTEIKSYTSNTIPDQDPLNIELRSLYEGDFAERIGGPPLELIARSRYSSVHIVLKAVYSHDAKEHVLPIEIQFRSVFEDAWAEIDHALLYELGRFGERVDEGEREAMAQHMSVLKKMVDTAAEYADVIRRTISVSRKKPVTIQRNLDDAEYIRELAPRAGLPKKLTDSLAVLLKEKVSLDDDITAGRPDTSALQYVDVANKLRVLTPAIEGALEKKSDVAARTILFSVRMEEALCRLLCGDPQQIRASVESYSSLTRQFPEFPAGWFRSAQAHQQLSELGDPQGSDEAAAADTAFSQYSEALKKLDPAMKLEEDERILLISPAQAAYIGVNAARLQGFAKWRLSDRRRRASRAVTQTDLDDVLLAYRVSKEALAREHDEPDRAKLLNNVIFYAADAHEMGRDLGTSAGLPETEEMRALLAELEGKEDSNILRLDTIVKASLVVGNRTDANTAARRILDLNAEGSRSASDAMSSPYVNEASDRAARHAWKVVRGTDDA